MAIPQFYGRTGPFTRRMLATVLAGQAIAIFFGAQVARGLAVAGGDPRSQTLLWIGSGLALLALAGAATMRGPIGVTLGWLVQVGTWASAVMLLPMIGVGLVFGGLWVASLVVGGRLDAQRRAAESGESGVDPAGGAALG